VAKDIFKAFTNVSFGTLGNLVNFHRFLNRAMVDAHGMCLYASPMVGVALCGMGSTLR